MRPCATTVEVDVLSDSALLASALAPCSFNHLTPFPRDSGTVKVSWYLISRLEQAGYQAPMRRQVPARQAWYPHSSTHLHPTPDDTLCRHVLRTKLRQCDHGPQTEGR